MFYTPMSILFLLWSMFTLYCTTCAFVTCLLIKGVQYSWNSTGPTPTLGMRLSCKFVNVYTIGYRVQYTSFTRVHARISNGHPPEDPREENRACRTSRRTSRRGSSCVSGSDKRAALRQLTASCGKLNGRHADILATILAKMSVSVSVSFAWNSSLSRHSFRHNWPESGPAVCWAWLQLVARRQKRREMMKFTRVSSPIQCRSPYTAALINEARSSCCRTMTLLTRWKACPSVQSAWRIPRRSVSNKPVELGRRGRVHAKHLCK